MRQLLPHPSDEVDALTVYLDDERPAPPDRPWVMLNMIASLDGATALEGRSGDLGGPADQAVFRAVRACSDWVMVASATANTERYRRPGVDETTGPARRQRGRTGPPRLAIVTASGAVDPTMPAIADSTPDRPPPLVVTGTRGDLSGLAGQEAETARLVGPTPEPAEVVAELGRRGARVVLAEGGPTFNGLLHRAGLLDEICLSVAPRLAGGSSGRIVQGGGAEVTDMRLVRVLEADGFLFLRYVRRDQPTRPAGSSST